MTNNYPKNKSVALALSGGVDSSVSAALLKEQGYDVSCIYMVCWDKETAGCSSDPDRVSAAKAASHLNLPLLVWDFTKEYKKRVIDYFFSEYKEGRTPNPDAMCNKEIKFGLFFDRAIKEMGFDYMATGHYARIVRRATHLGGEEIPHPRGEKYALLKGADCSKDQSYFLYLLNQEHLSKTLFPVGEYTKKGVRELAKKFGLPNAERPDSQGICFVGEVDVKKFLSTRLKPQKGKVLDLEGDIIGEHSGAWFYTIGQRHGFTVSIKKPLDGSDPEPLYVVSKNVQSNTITVGTKDQAMSDCFNVRVQIGGIPDGTPHREVLNSTPHEYGVRIRHLGEIYPIKEIQKSTKDEDEIIVHLENKAFGVAAGQSAVFYLGDGVLGGGIII